jgi:predicted deacetylase
VKRHASYIIRLDDACPTMRSATWRALEHLLDELNIRPVVGVIPDNLDPAMKLEPEDPHFWTQMRRWHEKGWELVMHGLHHVYHPIPLKSKPILSLSEQSEFVGLSLERQKQMLARGYKILLDVGLTPRAFMAPSHTFDSQTLEALREVTDIRIITDGHAAWPYRSHGFTWLPQQLWRYHEMPFGVWCICVHPNSMSQPEFLRLSSDLRRNAHKFIDASTALSLARQHSLLDSSFAQLYRAAIFIKRAKRHVST